MEKSEILLEIKRQKILQKIIAEAEENRKIRLAELDLEFENT